jgi:hypothetical protein
MRVLNLQDQNLKLRFNKNIKSIQGVFNAFLKSSQKLAVLIATYRQQKSRYNYIYTALNFA